MKSGTLGKEGAQPSFPKKGPTLCMFLLFYLMDFKTVLRSAMASFETQCGYIATVQESKSTPITYVSG